MNICTSSVIRIILNLVYVGITQLTLQANQSETYFMIQLKPEPDHVTHFYSAYSNSFPYHSALKPKPSL